LIRQHSPAGYRHAFSCVRSLWIALFRVAVGSFTARQHKGHGDQKDHGDTLSGRHRSGSSLDPPSAQRRSHRRALFMTDARAAMSKSPGADIADSVGRGSHRYWK